MYLASLLLTHFRQGMEKPLLYKATLKILNLAALFLTFLASSTSCGSHLSWRKDRIKVIQLLSFWIAKVWIYLILGCFRTSIFKFVLVDPASNDAYFAISAAPIFWILGTCINFTRSNSWARCLVSLRYFCILSSFASYSSFICPTTSLESLRRSKFLAPNAFPTFSPVNIVSYSASLLVAENWSWTPYLSVSPFRVTIITPTMLPFRADDPST